MSRFKFPLTAVALLCLSGLASAGEFFEVNGVALGG